MLCPGPGFFPAQSRAAYNLPLRQAHLQDNLRAFGRCSLRRANLAKRSKADCYESSCQCEAHLRQVQDH